PNGGGGFVTFRAQNGDPLPGGQGPVTFVNAVMHLEPAANGMLEVTTPVPGAYMEKALIRPDLTLDPSPRVPVPSPSPGLLLPDGSRIDVHEAIFTGVLPLLRIWLTRLRPDGTTDPMFGGRDPAVPFAGMSIDRASFDGTSIGDLEVRGPFL